MIHVIMEEGLSDPLNVKSEHVFVSLRDVSGTSVVLHPVCRWVLRKAFKGLTKVADYSRAGCEFLIGLGDGESQRRAREVVFEPFIKRYDNSDVKEHWQKRAQLNVSNKTSGHSHGTCAQERTAAACLIDDMAHQLGRKTYVVSACHRERSENPTYHGWYIDKDLIFQSRRDDIPRDAIVKMVDVDYYVDWSVWARHARPIALYTFVPRDVRFSNAEYSYALTPRGVQMHVNGGTTYVHQLWNYSNDFISITTRWWKKVVYSVSVKRVGDHHRLVLLTPVYSVRFFGHQFPSTPLSRMDFTFGTNGVLHTYRTTEGDVVSAGLLSSGCAVTSTTLGVDVLEAIRLRLLYSKHPTIGDVERYLRTEGDERAAINAPPLFAILTGGLRVPRSTPTDMPGSFNPQRYMILPKGGTVCDDGKPLGRALCPPIVTNPDFIPLRCTNNDVATVAVRVEEPKNHRTPVAKFERYAQEFIDLLVPINGKGCRLNIDDVIELQARPTQRGRSEKVEHWLVPPGPIRVQAFMKGESYGKPAAPRNISTVPTDHTLQLSAYTYAFKRDVLYPLGWYSPGKKPADIAARLGELASSHPFLVETDFTTFDGTKSKWLCDHVVTPMYLRWVAPENREDLKSLLEGEQRAKATTAMGVCYSTAYTTLSGSPITTDGNSCINAFVSYAAARNTMTPKMAWASLGSYAGDDGMSTTSPSSIQYVAKELGLKLKCETRQGNFTYLGRLFYQADSGNIGSVQDPERTWRKLHLSFAPRSVPDDVALANRAAGYLALDPKAPVTSDWCKAVMRITGIKGVVTIDAPYYAYCAAADRQFGGWPQMPPDLAFEAIGWRLNRSPSEVRELSDRIRCATSLADFDSLWSNPEPETPFTVVVDGQVRKGRAECLQVDSMPGVRRGRTRRVGRCARDREPAPFRGNCQMPFTDPTRSGKSKRCGT